MPEDQQNGKIADYSIQIEGPNITRNVQTTIGNFSLDAYTFKEVSDLRPSTEYTFSVSAMTVAGSGPAISVSFTTPQEGETSMHAQSSALNSNSFVYTHSHTALSNTIGSLKTSQYHPASAQISWEAVKADDKTVTGYTARVEGPDSTQLIPISDDITSVKISNLRPSTQYTFKVSAVTVADNKSRRGETSMPYYSLDSP